MTQDFIRADDLARELGKHSADLYEQAILGTMPQPYWRRNELVEWVAGWSARQAVAEPEDGGNDE